MAIKENELTEVTTLDDNDKIRVVSVLNGLSQVITAKKLKDSFLLTGTPEGIAERIEAIEAVVDDGKPLATQEALAAAVEDIREDLGYQSDEDNQPTKVFQRIFILESEVNGMKEFDFVAIEDDLQETLDRLYILDGGSVEGSPSGLVYQLQSDIEAVEQSILDLSDLTDTKLDQSAFQNAVNAGFKMIRKTPASVSAAGEPGEVCWDTEYLYVCVAVNTWKRMPLQDW